MKKQKRKNFFVFLNNHSIRTSLHTSTNFTSTCCLPLAQVFRYRQLCPPRVREIVGKSPNFCYLYRNLNLRAHDSQSTSLPTSRTLKKIIGFYESEIKNSSTTHETKITPAAVGVSSISKCWWPCVLGHKFRPSSKFWRLLLAFLCH